jgi:hypothetical protein
MERGTTTALEIYDYLVFSCFVQLQMETVEKWVMRDYASPMGFHEVSQLSFSPFVRLWLCLSVPPKRCIDDHTFWANFNRC